MTTVPQTPIENAPYESEISVSTQNIFPIIKKWLYSERDIFLRELVSNACDAVTKLKRLVSLGETALDEENFRIDVTFDKEASALTITDNGIGMTEEEVREYLCNIALSGALKFIEKYEGAEKSADSGTGIIGHFGLGFYSAFMVAETVEVRSRSYTDAPAVRATFRDDGRYKIEPETAEIARGTSIILHLTEEAGVYLDSYKLREILSRYCSFMPYPIYVSDYAKIAENEAADGETSISSEPLWDKNPSDVSEKEYNDFYAKLFGDFREPLFHVHIKADYPLNFRGILYFPRLRDGYDSYDGQVKLYYNRVFVADNIKEILPEHLIALRGVIDCPELPLNVSRSYLQNDAYAKKVAAHIAKKITDRLTSLASNERENYIKIWRDIKLFIEYGAVRDGKFYDRMKSGILYERVGSPDNRVGSPDNRVGSHDDGNGAVTLEEYFALKSGETDKTIYYATDKVGQAVQIEAFCRANIPVVLLDRTFDTQFIETVEQREEGVKFCRIDAASDALKSSDADDWNDEDGKNGVKTAFESVTPNETEITFAALRDESISIVLSQSEETRRMEDMMRMYRMSMPDMDVPASEKYALRVNSASRVIRSLAALSEERRKNAARALYLLALTSVKSLTADEQKNLYAAVAEMIIDN